MAGRLIVFACVSRCAQVNRAWQGAQSHAQRMDQMEVTAMLANQVKDVRESIYGKIDITTLFYLRKGWASDFNKVRRHGAQHSRPSQ